jgi:hypothetical protein
MANFEFQSILYHNAREVAAAIAGEWMTAGGMNCGSDIREFFLAHTNESLTDECISAWGLLEIVNADAVQFEGGEPETWLESRGIDRNSIITAFADLRALKS